MFSIIIPTKNEEQYLPFLLKSLKKQTFLPKEIIVADAGSNDQTRQIAFSFGCQVVDGGLPGPGRNRGASVAKESWLLFFDADVELDDPTFLKRASQELEKKKFDIATCNIFPLSHRRIDHFSHCFYNFYARACQPLMVHAPGFCIFIKRDLHESIGGFDENIVFCEDHEYARRASKKGRFGFLSNRFHVPVSTRRFDHDGRLTIMKKFFGGELHLLLRGPIRDNRFHYELDYKKNKRI